MLTVNESHPKYASKPSNTVINSFNFCGMRGSGKKMCQAFLILRIFLHVKDEGMQGEFTHSRDTPSTPSS